VLRAYGPGSCRILWRAPTLLGAVTIVPVLLARLDGKTPPTKAGAAHFSIAPILIYLASYFLFGAGHIAYLTFMIAYVPDSRGKGGILQPDRHEPSFLSRRVGLARRARARPLGFCCRDHPFFNARREPADLRPLGHAARDIGAGVWCRPDARADLVGAINDVLVSVAYALNVSATLLAFGAAAAAFQGKLRKTS
jgi:Uncharacterised MFS-type transporter YbfB